MSSVHDNNNNLMEKSYSLRPRSTVRKDDQQDQEESWKPKITRSRKKSKQKSLPLSKYRRKTANARERFRMREINEAFEALRRAIPHLSSKCDNPNEKLTKISTLRLAMKYITALSNALHEDLDSDAESLLSDWTLTTSDIRESSTPSSVNEQQDSFDNFFSSSSESSPTHHSPCNLSSLLTSSCDFVFPDPHEKTPVSAELISSHLEESVGLISLTKVKPLDRLAAADPRLLVPSPLHEPLVHFLPPDLPHSDSVPSLLEELADLSSHAVDFEEYLIT